MDCDSTPPYRLDDQVGYLLRLASQRHAALFARLVSDGLTPTQFAALIRLAESGPLSQNQLGRMAAMDAATIKGVVERLNRKGLITLDPDPTDRRRTLVGLSKLGRAQIGLLRAVGQTISDETLGPLTPAEQSSLLKLLRRLG